MTRARPRLERHPRARPLPSRLYGRSRSFTGSTPEWLTGGRGLSPPVGNLTPPRRRALDFCRKYIEGGGGLGWFLGIPQGRLKAYSMESEEVAYTVPFTTIGDSTQVPPVNPLHT